MIQIQSLKDCCGCTACTQKCPRQCISLYEDNEGFLYPSVDSSRCINCDLCVSVCPVLQQGEKRMPLFSYAAKNKDEKTRKNSSSGGLFTLFAEEVINKGGVVFGAKFNQDWDVIHDYTEDIEGLSAFRVSKYTQSRIGDTFSKVEHFLKLDRKVLFSGTPCQVAGLKRFLRKEYNNLFAIDFICHGVPSPKVWKKYRIEVLNSYKKNDTVSYIDISFRDKSLSWKRYHFNAQISISSNEPISFKESFGQNVFMRGFLSDLYLRPSCYDCCAKSLKSKSDITIADYWGIQHVHPEFDDDKGTNLVLINNPLYDSVFKSLSCEFIPTLFDHTLRYNPSIEKSARRHPRRDYFFKHLDENIPISKLINVSLKEPIIRRLKRKIKSIAKRLTLK